MMNCRPETRRAAAWLAVLVLTMSVLHAQSKKAAPSEDLNTLLAPIALYPDQLLAQMLMCATSPGDVVALNGWLATTTNLKGTALQDAATKTGFEPSFVAMALFPQTVKMMADQLDWTTRVGLAFTANRSAVFNAIQRLRAQAKQTGTSENERAAGSRDTDDFCGRRGHRHRTGQSPGRVRPAIQPASRLHATRVRRRPRSWFRKATTAPKPPRPA